MKQSMEILYCEIVSYNVEQYGVKPSKSEFITTYALKRHVHSKLKVILAYLSVHNSVPKVCKLEKFYNSNLNHIHYIIVYTLWQGVKTLTKWFINNPVQIQPLL